MRLLSEGNLCRDDLEIERVERDLLHRLVERERDSLLASESVRFEIRMQKYGIADRNDVLGEADRGLFYGGFFR